MKLAFAVLCLLSCVLLRAAEPPITESDLIRRTQELYDSLVTGDKTPWKKHFADDCTFSDEKGRTFDKTKLVADIIALPKGYSGAIKIDNVISRIIGGTAVLSYDTNETETIFDQELHARYHVTDTWLRRNGKYEIIASQAHRYYEDPALGTADEKKFPDYVGTYQLAPGQTRTVSVENRKLFIERNGKKEELLPETSICFSAKASKAASCSITTPPAKSTPSSTEEITRMSSGRK